MNSTRSTTRSSGLTALLPAPDGTVSRQQIGSYLARVDLLRRHLVPAPVETTVKPRRYPDDGYQRLSGAVVVINVFDGGPGTRVMLTLERGVSHSLAVTRVAAPDPFIVDTFGSDPSERPSWLQPGSSSHLWMAEMPPSLAPGRYTLTARAIDLFGREFVDRSELRVV